MLADSSLCRLGEWLLQLHPNEWILELLDRPNLVEPRIDIKMTRNLPENTFSGYVICGLPRAAAMRRERAATTADPATNLSRDA